MNYTMEELLPLVQMLSEKYTSKQSTSISENLAKQLMGAVIYCINERCSDTKHREIVKVLSAKEAYHIGYEKVIQKTKEALKLYENIMAEFKDYGNRCYYDTMVKGMPQFFLYYDAKFNPQNRILTLDYPTPVPIHKLQGVDAIYEYLKYIWKEQRILSRYSEKEVRDKLFHYYTGYEDMIENIYEIFKR